MAKKDIFEIPDEKVLNLFFEQQRKKTLVVLQNRLALSHDDAEDIYQEACVALYQNIQSGKLVELTSSLSTYFTSICMNKGKKLLDRRPDNISFEGAVENTEGDEYSTSQIETILGLGDGITAEQRATMRDIVQDLPSPCEEILWSYYGDGLQMKEIAELIGFNGLDSVKSKKSQCMSKLKERFMRIIKEFYE